MMIAALRLRLLFSLLMVVLFFFILEYHLGAFLETFVPREMIYCVFNARETADVIDNTISKSVLVLGRRWGLLGSSCVFAGQFTALVLGFWMIASIVRWKSKTRERSILYRAVSVIGWAYIFFFVKSQFSSSVSVVLTGLACLTCLFNVVLSESSAAAGAFIRRCTDWLLFVLLFVAETLFLPLYLSRAGLIRHPGFKKTFSLFHWIIILFGSAILAPPLISDAFLELKSLGNLEGYDLKLSKISSKLFVYSSETPEMCDDQYYERKNGTRLWQRIESLNIGEGDSSFELVYRGNRLSQFLELSDEDEEIYFIDRGQRNLMIVDMNTYEVKNIIFSESFDSGGDSYLARGEDVLYVLGENSEYMHRIDTKKGKIIAKKPLESINANLIFNRNRSVLYSTDFLPSARSPKSGKQFFLSEVDGESLDILRRVPLAGPSNLLLTRDGSKLFCLVMDSIQNNWIYIFDTETMSPIEKIPVVIGSREIAIDEARGFLFVGNALTGLIDVINLKSREVVATYRAGRYSLRKIVVDEERRAFYVSTQYFGLYQGIY